MNYRATFLFLFVFILEDINSIPLTHPSSEYDITTCLGGWINNIFENNQDSNEEIDNALRKAFASAEYHRVKEIEYNITDPGDSFESKIIFHDVNFYTHSEDAYSTKPFSLVTRRLSNDKATLSTPYLRITLEVELRKERNEPYGSLFTTLHFDNFVLTAIRSSNDPNNATFSFDFSYDHYNAYNHGYDMKIKWYGIRLQSESDSDSDSSAKSDVDKLTEEITPILPVLLREHMNRNPQFSQALDKITKIYRQPSEIISSYPDFQHNPQLYYYFIPEVPFYGLSLKNVVVQGLANIESIDIDKNSEVFTHTLLVKNIQGSVALDYRRENETPMELKYQIGYLSISIKENADLVHVEARSYSVNRTSGSCLTYLQSAVIMEKIESAVASALMPTKKVWKPCNFELEIDEIRITNTSDWKAIKESYQKWIPFNQDAVAPKRLWIVQRIFLAAGGNFFMMNR